VRGVPANRVYLEGPHRPTALYQVGREKIREFATAVGAEHPFHHDLAAATAGGHADLVAPPTFPIVLSLAAEREVVTHPDAGIDYARVVHREQRFVHHRAVVAGDTLTAQVHLHDVREMAGNDVVSCRTEVLDARGDAVVTAYSTLVARGTAEPGRQ